MLLRQQEMQEEGVVQQEVLEEMMQQEVQEEGVVQQEEVQEE